MLTSGAARRVSEVDQVAGVSADQRAPQHLIAFAVQVDDAARLPAYHQPPPRTGTHGEIVASICTASYVCAMQLQDRRVLTHMDPRTSLPHPPSFAPPSPQLVKQPALPEGVGGVGGRAEPVDEVGPPPGRQPAARLPGRAHLVQAHGGVVVIGHAHAARARAPAPPTQTRR